MVLTYAAHSGTAAPTAADVAASGRASMELDGLVYEFDAIAGREWLSAVGAPDVNLLHERPEDALRLRRALEHDLGLSLERLSDANRATIDALKRMGYL
ncbi:MAG: hypothetical protein K8T90_04130 [Planctomycetes bacterium]|nr:hypothetical protein [Planctomycetota bacterium]